MPRKQSDLLTSLFASVKKQQALRKESDTADKEAVLLSAMMGHQRT